MATPIQPLDFYDGPMVWIDCEMTGLNPRKDKILEIAVLITDGNLKIVDEGLEFVIKTEKSVLERNRMDTWCTRQHGNSGLTLACLKSPHTIEDVSKAVLAYIKKWIPKQRVGVLAGNSVHADRSFLVEEMPGVIDWLHYRIIDVSSVKVQCDLMSMLVPSTMFLGNISSMVSSPWAPSRWREFSSVKTIVKLCHQRSFV
ncbi:hypothetical protein K443DRAFT_671776 [Laccaria amethystina LaAM-08-1]|uniref:Exonuclease domain-containing protein n=1 Tax=Laccaria amethystina LaAM-08-1 TaxID=1095629 RepID=A0A0C9XAG9_9AGAR|nr:hypothetical protein K443DRAFT_671776 [Laccaria amethystina LaAM-08-1]